MYLVHLDPRVPQCECVHAREALHRLPVGLGHCAVDRLSLFGAEAAVAAGDGEARDESLQVPLERARKRLVEVVDVEDEPPVGRGECTEVGEVRIPAELDLQPRPRAVREIGRHWVGGAAEERERRHEHASVSNRDKLRHASGRLLLEQVDRIAPVRRRAPLAEDRAPHLGPRSPSPAPPARPASGEVRPSASRTACLARRRSSRQAASVTGRRAWAQGSSPQPGSAHLAQAARSEGSLPPALWPRSPARAERRRPGAMRRRAAAAREDRPSTRGLHPGPRWCDRNQSFLAAVEDLGERNCSRPAAASRDIEIDTYVAIS